MRYSMVFLTAILVMSMAAGSVGAAPPTAQDVVNAINQTQYADYLNNYLFTHNGDSRGGAGVGTQHDLARTNIFNEFVADGLTTTLQACSGGSNVVGVKLGRVHPNDIYILGAHYDSVPAGPGADDNASGTAGVLTAAKAMKDFTFEDTVIFCAFDREEQGMVGSWAYYNAHSADDVKGMISLDMIAFNSPAHPNTAQLYGRTDAIQSSLIATLATQGITAQKNGAFDASDQTPWDRNGKPACLLIEWHSDNGRWHQATDSVDTANYIDYAYATKLTRAAVGFLAESAAVTPEPGSLCLLALGGLAALARRRRLGPALGRGHLPGDEPNKRKSR